MKQLWREMKAKHKALPWEVATRGGGASQTVLEGVLGVDWQSLRGVHNGLARICERLEIEKPVRATGYNSTNRTYHMDSDVAHTVRGFVTRDKKRIAGESAQDVQCADRGERNSRRSHKQPGRRKWNPASS